jgi:hypothetical protein
MQGANTRGVNTACRRDGESTNRNKGSKSNKAMMDVKMWGLNILSISWGAAMWLTDINIILGIVGGCALIWANIEKAVTERNKRK